MENILGDREFSSDISELQPVKKGVNYLQTEFAASSVHPELADSMRDRDGISLWCRMIHLHGVPQNKSRP